MEEKRPEIQIPMTTVDITIEILCIAIMSAIFLFTITKFISLPAIIPTHFNAAGEVDGHGGRATVFFLFPVIFLMYAGLTILQKFPQIYNYVVEITPENARRQYTIAARVMRLIKLEIIMIFSYLEYVIIISAMSNKFDQGAWFLPLTFIGVFGTIGVYIYKSVKAK